MALTPKDIVLPEVPCDGALPGIFNRHGNPLFEEDEFSYQALQDDRVQEWHDTVRDYEANPDDVYTAWHYLNCHPVFWKFRRGPGSSKPLPLAERLHERHLTENYGIHHCVSITVVKINPATRSTDGDEELRTETEVWIELGKQPWPKDPGPDDNPYDGEYGDVTYHDYKLDCGGPTIDAAIIAAARNVWDAYGNDRRICDAPHDPSVYAAIRARNGEPETDIEAPEGLQHQRWEETP